MSKRCLYCSAEFEKTKRSEFIRAQFFEFLFCHECEEKQYVALEPNRKSLFTVINLSSYLIAVFIVLFIQVSIISFMTTFMTDKSFFGMKVIVVGAILFGIVFLIRRKIARFIYWNFSEIKKSPFN